MFAAAKMAQEKTRSYEPVANSNYDVVVRSRWKGGKPVDVVLMKFGQLGKAFAIGPLPQLLLPKKAKDGEEMKLEDKVDVAVLPPRRLAELIQTLQRTYASGGLEVTPHYLCCDPEIRYSGRQTARGN